MSYWPRVSFTTTSFVTRLGIFLLLAFLAQSLHENLQVLSARQPEGWTAWWIFGALTLVLFSQELLRFFSFLRVFGLENVCQRLQKWENACKDHRRHASSWAFKGLLYVLDGLLSLLRLMVLFTSRILTYPIRTYYHPTATTIFTSLMLHWLAVGCLVWMVERRFDQATAGVVESGLSREFLDTLWRIGMFLVNHSFDQEPLSLEGKVFSLLGMITFLILLAVYGNAVREARERLTLQRLPTKPRLLPMYGHSLVTGDITAIRMLLHQFQHHGIAQDVVVATRNASTATVTGLGQLSDLVWSVEGNLWEEEVRKAAGVDHANELIVLGATLEPIEISRTIAAIESDNRCVNSVIDARYQDRDDNRLIRAAVQPNQDFLLDWSARRPHLRACFLAIPRLCELLTEVLHYRNRTSYPRQINLAWRRFFAGLLELLDKLKLGAWGLRGCNAIPLVPRQLTPPELRTTIGRLVLHGEPLHASVRTAIREWFRPPARESKPEESSSAGTTPFETAWTEPVFVSALDGTTLAPLEPDTVDTAPWQPNRAPSTRKTLAQQDQKLLDLLCRREIWKQPRRWVIEFHEPDSVESLQAICASKHCRTVEAYSDLQLRVFCLALCALMGASLRDLLECLWPARSQEPKLQIQMRTVADVTGDLQRVYWFGRAVSLGLRRRQSLLAYRPGPLDTWRPCAFGQRLRPEYQALVLTAAGEEAAP